MKRIRTTCLLSFVLMILLSGCSLNRGSNHSNPSTPLKQTQYNPSNTNHPNAQADDHSNPSKTDGLGPKPSIVSIGFLEPSGTNKDVKIVGRTAKHLSNIAFFSYRVKPDGSLIPVKDATALKAVQNSSAKPMLVITNFANGTFSPDVGHAILTHSAARNKLMENVIRVMKTKHYSILNIDFEHLKPEDRDRYTQFLKTFVPKIHRAGFTVSTALAPKQSSQQTGSWYTAHDYGAHGKLMDFVILMTYEWGWTGGPPMAVAPIPQIKKVLDYAVTVIPKDKIVMGMPLYGYDWTLPYKKGGPPAKRVSFQKAAALAKKEGAQIQYDQKSQAPFFHYKDSGGKKHVVWFENDQSLRAKLNLVKKYHLHGVSYWELGQKSPQNWRLLNKNFKIQQTK